MNLLVLICTLSSTINNTMIFNSGGGGGVWGGGGGGVGGGGGPFYPSTVLVDSITCLESVFREQVPLAIHRPKIGIHFMSKVKDASSISSVTCSNIVYVHIGAILYGAIVLYCQNSPSSSGTKQANTAP